MIGNQIILIHNFTWAVPCFLARPGKTLNKLRFIHPI